MAEFDYEFCRGLYKNNLEWIEAKINEVASVEKKTAKKSSAKKTKSKKEEDQPEPPEESDPDWNSF